MRELDIPMIAKLVVRARNNDSDAFAELYALTYNKVYNYARHYLRDEFLAQDALQEVYILALKNINKLNDPNLFIAWINRISFNVCYDMSKKQNAGGNSDPEILETIPDASIGSNPEVLLQRKDENQRLHHALEQLPFLEKEVVVMRFYNNMKLEEIASALDISRSSVKRYIAAGQSKLKKLMEG